MPHQVRPTVNSRAHSATMPCMDLTPASPTLVTTGAAIGDLHLDLGEIHPSGHGGFRLQCSFSDEPIRVTRATPVPGLLHRGTEKLLEVRDYRSGLMLANRHDWLSAVTSEVTMALAAESLLGLQVPPRATWLRTLLCEMNRAMAALSHLMGVAALPGEGISPVQMPGAAAREAWQLALERISGGRLHAMVTRIGGIAADAPDGWAGDVRRAIDITERELPVLMAAVRQTISAVLTASRYPPDECIAVLSTADATGYGVSGPVARASGLDVDLRRDDPPLAYADLQDALTVITADSGDAAARYEVLGNQLAADLPLIAACLERLPSGEVSVPLPKVVRAPEGTAYAWLESATGITGVFLVSTGETTPWRVRLRTPSYANVQSMTAAMPGTPLGALPVAIGSFMFVVGDLDH